MQINSFSLEDLLQEIRDRAEDDGVSSEDQWNELVEEVIEDHVDLGQIDQDQDTEEWKDTLKRRWDDYKTSKANQLENIDTKDGE